MFEKNRPRTWGFRFSATDALAIGVFVIAAMLLRRTESPLWWMVAFVAGHFFLFCNVFRVHRIFELVWAGLFVANVGLFLVLNRSNWIEVVALQLPVTAGFITVEIRSGRYHGIFARRLNRRLDDYLKGQKI